MSMRPLAVCCLALVVGAEDIVAPPPPSSPDPTAAVVAEGRFVYRQRDLDALLAIAKRHSNGAVSRAEEDQIRQALIAAMPAREALVQALAMLPASLPSPARDRLVLDLLDYQADLRPPRALTPETAAPDSGASPTAPSTGETAATTTPTGETAAPASAAPAPSDGPLIVRLPQLILPRTLDGLGERTMTLSLAFTFADGALAKTLEAQSPLIQDAVLSYLHNLDPGSFAKPNQPELKAGINAAIRAKVPSFPEDAVLIPELDVSIPDKTKSQSARAD